MSVRIIIGDALIELRKLPDESVHCCVTSPPYYGLRDYGTAQWDGGDAGCDHLMPPAGVRNMGRDRAASNGKFHDSPVANQIRQQFSITCGHCGARRIDQQIGLEPSPDEYIAALVSVFREVRRVLRKDGTLWLNIGDSYASSPPGNKTVGVSAKSGLHGVNGASGQYRETLAAGHATKRDTSKIAGIKPKDLIGIPWLLAFALRSDGWYLRQDIIWSKPNPMPESVTDRCTKAHEYLFLLAKSQQYHYDAEAIKEDSLTNDPRRPYTSEGAWQMDGRPDEQRRGGEPRSFKGSKFNSGKTAEHQLGRASSKPRTAGNKSHKYVTEYEASDTEEHRTKAGLMKVADVPWEMRNRRSVWTVATAPYSEAHFATFPPALIEPCIKAGCPPLGTVLDPFGGAGTTGLVADRLGRNAILIELNESYALMAKRRLETDGGMFVQVQIERSGQTLPPVLPLPTEDESRADLAPSPRHEAASATP